MQGIDYAWGGPRGALGALKAAGFGFICRYLSSDSGKNLTAAEKASALSHGLAIVVVWETTANRALGGSGAGAADARAADAEAKALGMAGVPIYFAVDFDASAGQQSAINAYLDGAASVIGRARVGIYGGYYPVSRAMSAGKAKYGWQTYAWSGGQWYAKAQLRQTRNSAGILGYDDDLDVSMATDFGQWPRPGNVPPPPPPVKPESQILKQGASGDAVKYLQTRLNVWGAKLAVDSSFGPATLAAVKAFQTTAKLTSDGVVGPPTWTALDKTPGNTPPPPPVKAWKAWTAGGMYSLADFAKNVAGKDVASLLTDTVKHYGKLDTATSAYLDGLATGTVQPTDKIKDATFWVYA